MLAGIVQWLVLAGCYLGLTGSPSVSEFIVATLVALAGVLLPRLVRSCSSHPFSVRAPWLRVAARTGLALLRDTARVTGVLARTLWSRHSGRLECRRGVIDQYPGVTRPARRAIAALEESIAPNSLVVDSEGVDLQVHRLS